MPNITIPAMEVSLPFYIRAHWSPSKGQYFYRWEVSGRLKKKGFRPASKTFGTDLELAIKTAEEVLLPSLRDFVENGHVIEVADATSFGSVDMLIKDYEAGESCKQLRDRTRQTYIQKLKRGANHVFRAGLYKGRRLGSLQVTEVTIKITRQFVAEFATVTKTDADGHVIEYMRNGDANHIKATFGTVWFDMYGLDDNVPFENPWARTKRRKHKKRKTIHATIEDLAYFIVSSRELEMPNIGVGALFAFEFEMRVESILTRLMVEHYKPFYRPQQVLITHWKTDEEVWVSLYDSDGQPLYPVIEAALDKLKGDRTSGILIPRDGTSNAWAKPDAQLPKTFYEEFDIVAGPLLVAKGVTFTSFRHGGITEGAEAGLTEFELMTLSGHKDPKTIQTYVKQTSRMFETAQRKRLTHRSRVIEGLKRQGYLNEWLEDVTIQSVLDRLPPVPAPTTAPLKE